MTDTMLVAFIGAGGALLVSIVTLMANAFLERFKSGTETQQKEYQAKREYVTEVYKELISIINLYPNASPNDILNYVENPPTYSMENFNATLNLLNYQIEDYRKQLDDMGNINRKRKTEINMQILNIEYTKKEISKIRDEYNAAKNKYKLFCESKKVIFDLYAGQEVRNCLVEFETNIYNVFISGRKAGDKDDPMKNIIQVSRRNLVNSMRKDIGIN